MAISSAGTNLLGALLPEWHLLLQGWSADGRLTAAAQEALLLNGAPQALTDLTTQWSAGKFGGLPTIVLLSAADINGAMGAYAISTGTIYLNADWLAGATKEQVLAVLTEELGHHLDGVLNSVDTPGDEGEYFARLLSGETLSSDASSGLRQQGEGGSITIDGNLISAEFATTTAIRGNSLYTTVSGPSWTQAEANSIALGGHLAAISSKSENDYLFSTFGPTPNPNLELWIGLNDAQTEGVWQWSNGEAVTYTNWTPGVAPANTSGIVYGPGLGSETQDYVNFWWGTNNGTWDDYYDNDNVYSRSGIAEIPLTSSITFSTTPKEGAGVFTTSINLSAGTEASGNLAEGAQVWWKVTGITADDLASGALSGTGTIQNGKLDIQHSLNIDADAGESFEVSMFSDSSMTSEVQIGNKSSVIIIDGNNSPTDITLTSSGINENSAAGTLIGTLDANDPDAGSSFTYALVAGNGTNDADNALVEIIGNEVRVKSGASIDFETNPTLNLNIQVTDNGTPGLTYTKAVTAAVLNVNEAPVDIIFTSSGINENSPAVTVIGTLAATDPDAASSFTYALVTGTGGNDADNSLVEIVGNEVKVKSGAAIDFETNPVLNLNIQVTDNGTPGLTYTKAVTAAVLNVNEAPTDLIFDPIGSGINENSTAGTVVGALLGTDPDSGDTFTYELVAGNGTNDADNALVEIVGNEVKVKSGASIDFETNPVLNLNIQVTDNGGLTFTKAVSASVLDVVETPAYTITAPSTINEGAVLTTSVATTNVRSGTRVYYSLSGEGINTDDFSRGTLTGFGTVATNGRFSFLHTIT